jgi:hypothetical protein
MRKLVFLLCVLLATPAWAQGEDERRQVGLYKIYAGIGAMAVGLLMAASSGESASVTIPDPFTGVPTTLTASTRSAGMLYGGLAAAGVGGFLVWNGMQDRQPHRSVIVQASPKRVAVNYRRTW